MASLEQGIQHGENDASPPGTPGSSPLPEDTEASDTSSRGATEMDEASDPVSKIFKKFKIN